MTRRSGADAWKKFSMPTYQYACTKAECANRFDLVQSFTDPAATQCPVCGSAVRKVFSPVGVVFKGSGFYRNDSRSEPKTETKPAGSDGAGSGANKDAAASAPSGGKDGSSAKPDSSSTSPEAAAPAKQPTSGSSASPASSGSAGSAGSSAGKTAASA